MDEATRAQILAMASAIEGAATAVRLLVSTSEPATCAEHQYGSGDHRCVRPPGHIGNHLDEDGDAF